MGDQIPLLHRLRQATREWHERIERSVPLLQPGAGLREYAAYLRKLWGFLEPFEPRLWPAVEELGLPCSDRRKAQLVRRDLLRLGFHDQDVSALPRCAQLPEAAGARALGCAYVLEGSTLGGQVLSRELQQRLGGQVREATSFLTAYGARTGERWAAFRAFANALPLEEPERAQAEAAALDTFASLHRWLQAD